MGTWNPGPGATGGGDLFSGDGTNETADGLGGDDNLNGGAGDDILTGGDGNDTIAPGEGADTSNGGNGNDTINLVSTWSSGDVVDGGADFDTINIFNIDDTRFEFSAVSLSSIEALYFFSAYQNLSRIAFAGSQIGSGLSTTATITGNNASLDSMSIEFSSATNFTNTFTYVDWEERDVTILRGSNFNDTMTGSAFQDELFGNNGNDTLSAGAGNDRLEGGDGDDTLNGGSGSDFILVGTGTDTANGGDDNDDFFIQDPELTAGDAFNGGNGFDSLLLFNTNNDATLDFSVATVTSIERIDMSALTGGSSSTIFSSAQLGAGLSSTLLLIGSANISNFFWVMMPAAGTVNLSGWTVSNWGNGNSLTINGSFGADSITGSSVGDGISGNEGNDVLVGGGGDDFLNGGADNDAMYGGDGNDSYAVDDAGDQTIETSAIGGTDTVQASISFTITANIENLFLVGSAAINGSGNVLNNWIIGNSGANTLFGFDGNDRLDGGAGADQMFGGNGDDTYYVDNAGDVTSEASALGGTDIVYSSVNRALTANIENLTLTGTAAIGYGNIINNTVVGNASANTLYGFEGNDRLDGGAGVDTMFGAAGNDTYVVDNINDVTVEGVAGAGGGTDTIESSVDRGLNANIENLTLTGTAAIGFGNVLDNLILGNASANQIFGFDGNDTLDGGAGADQMYGGNGNDTYYVDNSSDVTSEASAAGGIDLVISLVSRTLTANIENLSLAGSGNNTGAGNVLDNVIIGNTGNNTLYGLDGNDTLNGAAGADILQGGAGADRYAFTSSLGAGNVDTILGYNVADDTIVLNNSVFTGLSAGTLAASAFVIGAAAVDADDRIIYNSSTGALYFDVDGVGGAAAVQFATLSTGLALTNNDFIIDPGS